MDFGQTEPSIRLSPRTSESLPVQYHHQKQQVHHNPPHPPTFHGSFLPLYRPAPEATPISETLHGERVIPVLFAIPRGQRQQRRNITNSRLNVGFHKVLGITIRRQPDKGVALLMLYKVGINTQQHFGITNTGRLHHIHLADVVAAHRIHDGPLKGQCFPAPFPVCGFFREIVTGIRPFNGGLWLRPEQ